MAKKQESNWNLETLTDAEVYAAIRYLEPDPRSANGQNSNLRRYTDSTVRVPRVPVALAPSVSTWIRQSARTPCASSAISAVLNLKRCKSNYDDGAEIPTRDQRHGSYTSSQSPAANFSVGSFC
jgi:hypothetical protein